MTRVRKILAPTDFSDLSTVGIRYALEMARDISAEVIVYHAIDFGEYWTNSPSKIPPYQTDMLQDRRRLLDRFLAVHCADCINLVEVRQVVEFGMPYKKIVEAAATEGVDLIVISTHGRTGIDHWILGSVAEKVVARAPCPVLVIPRHEGWATTAHAAQVKPQASHRSVRLYARRKDRIGDAMRLVKRAKEDIHFTERDWELLVRDKMKKVEGTGDELHCPKCSGNLDTYTLYGFVLDRCPSCAGIWIDEGELEGVVSQINPRLASEFAGV